MNHSQNSIGSFTFSFIKPHIVREGGAGLVKQIIIDNGFNIVASKLLQLDSRQVLQLYPHLLKIFGDDVINAETLMANTMSEAELMVIWSPSDNTASDFRQLVGRINSEDRQGVGIRGLLGESLFQNAIHGADSEDNAIEEIRISCPSLIDECLANQLFCDAFYSSLERYMNKQMQETCEETKMTLR